MKTATTCTVCTRSRTARESISVFVVGYFRYFAETLGEYMRQYQYLPDWAERPFNRLERAWVYRSAKGVSNLRSFGSENVPPFIFRNAAFPILDEEKRPWAGKQIGISDGPGACRTPYFAVPICMTMSQPPSRWNGARPPSPVAIQMFATFAPRDSAETAAWLWAP